MSTLPDIDTALQRLRDGLRPLAAAYPPQRLAMVGIHTGGVWLAERLHRDLGLAGHPGRLDINFYRDDFSRIGVNPHVRPSELPFPIDDRVILLVDDVLQSGRTVRAALNELFDYGRPSAVRLAVLVDRGGRELPVCADVVGTTAELGSDEAVRLGGPDPLTLSIERRGQ
ncbi:bifunctional pyr operon transcriptional regulator/uracil phosphoribosyltransferase PyrR [Arhodomonas sp. SL1]|uniref:bifunctional pyr operon transcriptional regulator/uracil phosphoribosyltransferase PyrR n=1 Tax=Arhodomonas sp. SL1 TaxID=3425691 RepID=UPI003F8803A5